MTRDFQETWHRYGEALAPCEDLGHRVHVWRARLDNSADCDPMRLSPDERERAGRFHQAGDRQRYVAGRVILRAILGDLTGARDPDPERMRFGYGAAGKPFLLTDPKLYFNVSHSEDVVLIAATRSGETGIDVERLRPMKDMDSVARVAFDDAEKAALMGAPAAARELIFYRIWTRKEALLKAMGAGIPALSDAAAVKTGPAASAWCLSALPHIDGYAAALARPRAAHGFKLWSWPNATSMRGTERRARPRPMPAMARQLVPHHVQMHLNEARP